MKWSKKINIQRPIFKNKLEGESSCKLSRRAHIIVGEHSKECESVGSLVMAISGIVLKKSCYPIK